MSETMSDTMRTPDRKTDTSTFANVVSSSGRGSSTEVVRETEEAQRNLSPDLLADDTSPEVSPYTKYHKTTATNDTWRKKMVDELEEAMVMLEACKDRVKRLHRSLATDIEITEGKEKRKRKVDDVLHVVKKTSRLEHVYFTRVI